MDMWGGEILTIPEIHIQTTLPPPPILSDSGRALSAYGVSRIVTPVGPTEYAWITPLRHVRRVPLLPVTSRRCSRQREKRVLLTRLNTFTSSITSSTPKLTFKSWNVIKFDETVPSRRRAGPHARTRRCDRDGALCRRRLSYNDPCSILCDATRNPQTPIPKAGALRAM